jgi:hypothetical protein
MPRASHQKAATPLALGRWLEQPFEAEPLDANRDGLGHPGVGVDQQRGSNQFLNEPEDCLPKARCAGGAVM